jgi:L-2-hydroxyglutarate oxidase LhgO
MCLMSEIVFSVLQQGTLCTYGIFATGFQVCTFRQAYMYIKETLPELVKHMVAAIQDPAEKPGTSVDVFNKCPGKIIWSPFVFFRQVLLHYQ